MSIQRLFHDVKKVTRNFTTKRAKVSVTRSNGAGLEMNGGYPLTKMMHNKGVVGVGGEGWGAEF